MSLVLAQSGLNSLCLHARKDVINKQTNAKSRVEFYLGLLKIWVETKMGHKVGVVMDSCESLGVITTGQLITVSFFCILRFFSN